MQTHQKALDWGSFVTSTPRIVSLVPSITELVVDLGLAPYLVGRTGFCIHPAAILQSVPKVGGTKDVNLAKIRKLAPTHVIVNVDENTLPICTALREFVPHVVVTHPMAPSDNLTLIDQICAIVATDSIAIDAVFARGGQLKDQISQALTRLQRPLRKQRVLYLIWRDPWMTVARDTYISQMLDLIGWQTWPDVQGGPSGAARYPALFGQEPWLDQLDRVLLSSEPYRFGPQDVRDVRAWLPHAQVDLVDGELLSWYGSRSVRGLAYLAELALSEASSV
jgi:ABC-type Fe3+-hydroxamate transport system substrate-binding protein